MGTKVEMLGRTFDQLVVLEEVGRLNGVGHIRWKCSCKCGKEVVVAGNNLRNGHTKSCGCMKLERISLANSTHGQGGKRTRLYVIWCNMKARCLDPNNPAYYRYGGRGIKVDPEWIESFEVFQADMGQPPSDIHTLEREKNNEGYNKLNCKWATPKEQARNRRNTRMLTHNGVTKPMVAWAEDLNIPYATLFTRLTKLNWPVSRALSTPESNQ